MTIREVYEFRTFVKPSVQELVESILSAVEGTVFYDKDGNALILDFGHEWIAYVIRDDKGAYQQEAYLSTVPLDEFAGLGENEHRTPDDMSELKGFETGFTC